MIRRVTQTCLVMGLCLALLSGCGKKNAVDKVPQKNEAYPKAYGDVIIQGSIADPAILNPVLASDSTSSDVTGLIFNSMLRYDKDLNLEGELAESWEISPDGKVLTFKIRKGVKWQDGMPLTARDVQFTLGLYLNPKVKTAYRSNYENIAKAQAVDDYTFKAWFKVPFAPALENLGGMPVLPRHLLAGKDINQADGFNYKPVGSGPYKLFSWKRAETVALDANGEYFDGRPFINRVVFRTVPDTSVEFMEMKNGSIDMMGLTPNQYTGDASKKNFTARFNRYRYNSNQYTYMAFNLKNPMFKNPKVRRAIALAINKEALVKTVLEGLGTVGTGPYTAKSWAYNKEVKPVPYDLATAKQLLQEAGYQYNAGGTLLQNGKPVEFTLLTNQGNKNREQTATIIQSQLQQVGIKVNIRIIAWSTFLSEFVNKRKFDALLLGWSLANDPDLYSIWHSSQTGEHEFNFVGYSNPEVDKLLIQGRQTFSRSQRQKIYGRVHELIAADLPYVFLYVPDSLPCVHRRFLGIEPGLAGIGYNFARWYVPKPFQKYTK